ncbi:unnamed protein product [Peniophora sp. CBMAI 1063]|nr:unnamed protein product [Peniophora sp. CBMAI 1063]
MEHAYDQITGVEGAMWQRLSRSKSRQEARYIDRSAGAGDAGGIKAAAARLEFAGSRLPTNQHNYQPTTNLSLSCPATLADLRRAAAALPASASPASASAERTDACHPTLIHLYLCIMSLYDD